MFLLRFLTILEEGNVLFNLTILTTVMFRYAGTLTKYHAMFLLRFLTILNTVTFRYSGILTKYQTAILYALYNYPRGLGTDHERLDMDKMTSFCNNNNNNNNNKKKKNK